MTGGAGFIGSHLTDALLAAGDDVLVLDDISRRQAREPRRRPRRGCLAERAGRIRRGGAGPRGGRASLPRPWFHLAAQIDVRRSMADPGLTPASMWWAPSTPSRRRPAQARSASSSRPRGARSTGRALGARTSCPSPSRRAASASRSTARSKLAAEGYWPSTAVAAGLKAITLRLGNVYGTARTRAGGRRGRDLLRPARRRPPTVFGDGTQTRDYIHVGDVAAACSPATRARPVPSTSAPAPRPRCWSWPSASAPRRPRRLSSPASSPPRGRGRAHRPRYLSAPERELGFPRAARPRGGAEGDLALTAASLVRMPAQAYAGKECVSASTSAGSAIRPACGTCSTPRSTSPACA